MPHETVTLRTCDLIGAALDWAVAKAVTYVDYHGWSPSTDWSQGGPLIEKHHVQTSFNGCGFSRSTTGEHWCAYACKDNGEELRPSGSGPTPLIAACRAIVSAHLGDSVDVPAELVGGGV